MWEVIRNLLRPKSARELAAAELAEAERSRLQAQSARDYSETMCLYHAQRIDRLKAYLAGEPDGVQ